MGDHIRDGRGQSNRYEIRHHKNPKKETEFYRILRKPSSSSRSPSRSSTKDTLIVPYLRLDSDKSGELDNELKPTFLSEEDDLAFQLHDVINAGNIDEIESLLSYSVPSVLAKAINVCGRPEGWFYPMESPLMAAARQGNDRIVRVLLEKCSSLNVNLTIDIGIELERDKTYTYWNDRDWICTSSNDVFNGFHSESCHGFCHNRQLNCTCCDCLYCANGYCENGFGRTALWLACFHGHLEVVRSLVEIGKADLNISDFKHLTPLGAAILQGHIHIVKHLIEQSDVIINESWDFSIAIQSGRYDIIDYLLIQRCDPNTRLIDYSTVSSSNDYTYFALNYTIDHHPENLSIIKTLLKHGSDPTLQNEKNETALHLAIRRQNKEIVQEILQYGFKHDQRDESNLTPLMLAITMDLTDIIEIFCQIFPQQEYIDAMMLLGSHFVFKNGSDFLHVDTQALTYFEKGLQLQEVNSNVQPCDVYRFRRECQTIDELQTIQHNPQLMYIQALLVYERLLPQRNEVHLLISELLNFYDYYQRTIGDYEQCLFILIHLYPMITSSQRNDLYLSVVPYLISLVDVLTVLITEEEIKYIDYIFQALEWTLDRAYLYPNYNCRLYLCAIHLWNINPTDVEKRSQLVRWVQNAIRRHYARSELPNLFNHAIDICLDDTEPLLALVSHKQFLHFLLNSGVDINEDSGYRPLHQVAFWSRDLHTAQSLTEILIAAGIHTDCLDRRGLLPEEQAQDPNIRNLLHTKRSRSLKCQCARLIISKGIQYQSVLSNSLKSFILMHQSRY